MKRVLPILFILILLCGCAGTAPEATLSVEIEAVHEDGRVLVEKTAVPLPEGADVLDALTLAAKEQNVPVVITGAAPTRYVEGIGGLFALDEGDMSGWLYFVNGESATVSADSHTVSDGDEYRFLFVRNFTTISY